MSNLRRLLAERHAYRRCIATCKRNPVRFPEGAKQTFKDWLDMPF